MSHVLRRRRVGYYNWFSTFHQVAMLPNFSTLFIFISLIIVISILDLAACDDDFDPKYRNCSRRFDCGRIRDIGYPFWGDGRADYCGGKVGYQLYCNRDDNDQEIPEIVINSVKYQVLSMSASSKSMSIARSDFMDDPCPANYINSTLDTSLFEYSAANTVNLTLFYDCVPSTSGPLALKQFTCNSSSSTTVVYNYFDIRDESIISTCRYKNMVTQVSKVGFDRLTSSPSTINLLGQVLKDGFDVEYSVDVSHCKACVDSGGQCGFDSALQIPTCFCFNGPSSAGLTCLTRLPTNKGKNKGLKILIAISVGASGIMVAIIMFCLWRRKCFLRKLMTTLAKKKTQSVQNVELFLINYGSLSPIRFKYSEIKRMTNSFQDKLGKGGYGSVFKGKLVDGRMVAVKLLSESKGNGDEFINEIASISRTSHVNIVTLLGFCVKGSKRALVYEFMPNGSLEKFIYDNSQPHLGWKTLYGITLGIARGLEYLHRGCNTRILHFDIKPHNILLDQVLCPKISDFGLSKLCYAKESVVSMTGARGTAGYIAPELIFRHLGAVSHKSDVYSYGMMVLEMVGGRKNVDATAANSSQIYYPQWIYNNLGLYQDLGLQGVTTQEDEEAATKMVLVGLWCIQMDPSNRPPMNQVLEMLEGSLEAIQIPPNPFLNSPTITPQQDHSNASISSIPSAR
ncbi:hypothetical protein Scep_023061 [Stephania cephalantha]|uniref:Protein kinase domain-containing protein n=1 Tax=Stephania cephalantha TaxID=152367 RepID=A0AAP0FDD1_9MAGN